MNFYTKPEYFADLIARLKSAGRGDRITAAAMVCYAARPQVRPLIEAMASAAHRGARVLLIVDAYDHIISGQLTFGALYMPIRPLGHPAKSTRADAAVLEQLSSAGGKVHIINQARRLFTSPVKGRSHFKFALINDRVYIGSANLEDYRRSDIMVAFTSPQASGWLEQWAKRAAAAGRSRHALPGGEDAQLELNEGLTLLADAGKPRRSLILDQAAKLIDEARERILLVSQYFPGGEIGHRLQAAKLRGVAVTVIYNHPVAFDGPKQLLQFTYQLLQRRHYPSSFFTRRHKGPGYMHAKLVATEQGVIVGSHNFVDIGVKFGTAELAILARDPEFARQATETVLRLLPPL